MSPSKKQAQRAAARERYERYLERRQHKLHRKQLVRRGVYLLLAVSLALGLTWWGFVAFGSSAPDPAAAVPTPSASSSTDTAASKICTPTTVSPIAKPKQFTGPKQVLKQGPATLTLATNCGDIDIALQTAKAPKNSNSVAFLAEQGYYDATSCHRLTTQGIFVLQCGDPTGTGSGSPGYTVADENVPADGAYPAGTVAMAEPSNGDAGSQFFIVYDDTKLPPNYTVVGEVTKGLAAVRAVAKAGVQGGGSDGAPAQPVVIDRATVTQP
ncbi:MAG: peptidylprolyl isomerase [Actinomycetes bacterium]